MSRTSPRKPPSAVISGHMLSFSEAKITKSRKPVKASAHLLPCTIRHSGPVDARNRYWAPTRDSQDVCTAYFRGRRLRGRVLPMPEGYKGQLVRKSGTVRQDVSLIEEMRQDLTQNKPDDDEEYRLAAAEIEDMHARGEGVVEFESVNAVADIDSITIWGHESVPDLSEDGMGRSMKEWMGLACAIHSTG